MKRTGLNIICSLLLVGGMCACTATPKQTEEIKWSERMAQSEMQRFPEPWMIEKAKRPRWGYTHGLVVKSMLEEWKQTELDGATIQEQKLDGHTNAGTYTLTATFRCIQNIAMEEPIHLHP